MAQEQSNNAAVTEAPKKKNRAFLIVLIVLATGGAIFGYTKYNYGLHHENTDDAQVDADISPVIPRISGYVTEVRVKDNQIVKKGDTLAVLDNRNELIALQQANAALSAARSNSGVASATTNVARANVVTYQANLSTAEAQIEAAKVTLRRATQDYDRYNNLFKDHSITQQQFEQAEAAKQSAERQLQVLEDQKNAASRQVSAANSQSLATAQQISVANASIEQRMADVENAKLNLSYTVILAPESGLISKVNVQVGQYLQSGQSLFSIVMDTNPWVVANFKETQLAKMKIGQLVLVHVDAIPGHEFKAKVASFSPATGARFALLPPDNASGNFVRVVQRLPVKIEIDDADAEVKKLRPGMNVDVDVHLD
jgi:membrane fusion protein (multidrug efflux system)